MSTEGKLTAAAWTVETIGAVAGALIGMGWMTPGWVQGLGGTAMACVIISARLRTLLPNKQQNGNAKSEAAPEDNTKKP